MKSNTKLLGGLLIAFTLIANGCSNTSPAEQIEGTYAGSYTDGEKTGSIEATINISVSGNNQVDISFSVLSSVIFTIKNVNITVQNDGTILLNLNEPLQVVTGVYKNGEIELNIKVGEIDVYLFVGVQQ